MKYALKVALFVLLGVAIIAGVVIGLIFIIKAVNKNQPAIGSGSFGSGSGSGSFFSGSKGKVYGIFEVPVTPDVLNTYDNLCDFFVLPNEIEIPDRYKYRVIDKTKVDYDNHDFLIYFYKLEPVLIEKIKFLAPNNQVYSMILDDMEIIKFGPHYKIANTNSQVYTVQML
jgi:hypothetical protein